MSGSTQRTIARNTLTNSLGFVVAFGANLVILPFIVHSLGQDVYGGIWTIVGPLTATLGLLDLGTGTAFVKYISEYHTHGDRHSLSELVNTGMLMYVVVGVVLLGIAWFSGEALLAALGVTAALLPDGVFVFRIGVLIFVLANILSPLSMVLTGIQRMDLNAYIMIGGQLVNVCGTVLVLGMGWGVRGLILNSLVVLTCTALTQCFMGLRLVPGIRFGGVYARWEMVRRFLRFGLNLQASKLAQVILFQSDRLVSLRMFGTVTAAYYDVGAKLCSAGRSMAFLTVSALIPAASELDARQDRERLLLLYHRASKYTGIAASTLFAFIGFFAGDIMKAWMGPEFLDSVPIVVALAAGYFFNISTGVASALAAGMGRTDFEGKYGVFAAIVNLPLSIGLGLALGPIGIAIGTSLTLLLGGIYFLYQIHRFLGRPRRTVIESLIKPLSASLVAGGVTLVLRNLVFGDPVGRGDALLALTCALLVFLLLDGVLLRASGAFGSEDFRILRGLLVRTPNETPA
jgi:O-antigen/teichoic acid export membrane protein